MNPSDWGGAIAPHSKTEALGSSACSRNEMNRNAIGPTVVIITFHTSNFQRIRSICATRSPERQEEKVTNCRSPLYERYSDMSDQDSQTLFLGKAVDHVEDSPPRRNGCDPRNPAQRHTAAVCRWAGVSPRLTHPAALGPALTLGPWLVCCSFRSRVDQSREHPGINAAPPPVRGVFSCLKHPGRTTTHDVMREKT